MTLAELIRFDILRYKEPRTTPEEVMYQILLRRVQEIAASGVEDVIVITTVEDKEKHDMLCSTIASRFFKDLTLYGPKIADDVMTIVAQVIKTVQQ